MNHASNDIRLLLVVGVVAMLLLFISVLLIFIFSQRKKLQYGHSLNAMQQQQQYQLVEAAVRSEEGERVRIAEQLHDEVGALLSSAKLHFRMVDLENSNGQSRALFEKGNELLNEAIDKVRGISHALHSHILQEFGLNEAIKDFAEKLVHDSLVKVSTNLDYSYSSRNEQRDMTIYRIVQELLNNILKHTSTNLITINSNYKDGMLTLNIVNNGDGLTQVLFEELRYVNNGLGLKNIQNRIYLLKGNISFYNIGNDFFTEITIPANND
jgi:signal transduction histidine kinase